MPSTTQNIPKAAEYAERIGDLFGQISIETLHQSALVGLAFDCCKAKGNTPDKVGALVDALNSRRGDVYELVFNLQDTVNLLLERVKELEASHV
jgi:hypothetical protein